MRREGFEQAAISVAVARERGAHGLAPLPILRQNIRHQSSFSRERGGLLQRAAKKCTRQRRFRLPQFFSASGVMTASLPGKIGQRRFSPRY
jgi:hypothetical protein